MKTTTNATQRDLLRDLNPAQKQAVLHTAGPLLILAGPGSGKTRVVTRRAAHLAATVARPDQILAITFTNKAAREMHERIATLNVADGMTVCTFHALCAKLLRIYHERAGVSRDFTIFDRDDRRKVIKRALEEENLSTDNWSPAMLEREISLAKNDLLTPDEFAERPGDWRRDTIVRVYARYEQVMADMAGLDFDDLLMRVALLLERDAELCDRLEDRYRYLLIDEYQDTNAAQYKIARSLTQKRKNICATGDPDQSIYGWRGADLGNILSFEHDYPEAKVVRLEQNYRSTGRILSAADRLIAGNVQRKEKSLWTQNDEGPSVRVIEFADGRAEADAIARDITSRFQNGDAPRDIAIFYRINSMSRLLEDALREQCIRYQIARGVEFYNRKEIKDVLAYLRVLVNPADEVSLLRIINTPARGIGATTVDRLVEAARSSDRSVSDVLNSDDDSSALGRSAGKVRDFGALLRTLARALELAPPAALSFVMSHSGLEAAYLEQGEGEDAPINNINELVNAAAEFHNEYPETTIVDWLEHTALISDVDAVDDDAGRVTLMTLHAAKGLEFPVVYVVGLEEGMLPFRRREEAGCDEEEERRLLFVGMTRSKRQLTLTHARFRMLHGRSERTVRSPFLDELPHDEVQWTAVDLPAMRKAAYGGGGQLPTDIDLWTIGTLVEHPVHGFGRIMSMQRGARRTHVEVRFKGGPQNTWVLEFAPLKRIDFDEVGDIG